MWKNPVPSQSEIDAVIAFELSIAPTWTQEIGYELEMIKEELLSFATPLTPVTSAILDGFESWCLYPRNSNYPEIAGKDFSKHPTALENLKLISKLRMRS